MEAREAMRRLFPGFRNEARHAHGDPPTADALGSADLGDVESEAQSGIG
jgi:hypothetical protein